MERKIINGSHFFSNWIESYKHRMQQPPMRFETGITIFDTRLAGGFQQEQLGIIGGLPGTGKTTLVLQIAVHMARQGYPVLIYEYEMSPDKLIEKMIARDSHIILNEIMNGIADVTQFKIPEGMGNLHFAEATPDLTGKAIIDDIEAVITKDGLPPVIVIDYLQKLPNLTGKSSNDPRITVNDNLTMLKMLAVNTKGLVLAISSMNRESAKSGDISMTAFRESSDIEYSADVLISMGTAIQKKSKDTKQMEWTEAKSDELQGTREQTNVVVKFNFLKVRHYKEGTCLLNFYRNYQNFASFVSDEYRTSGKTDLMDDFNKFMAKQK